MSCIVDILNVINKLESYESIVKLISATKTSKGLKVKARLDKTIYEKGVKITDEKFADICLKFHRNFPHWSYIIHSVD